MTVRVSSTRYRCDPPLRGDATSVAPVNPAGVRVRVPVLEELSGVRVGVPDPVRTYPFPEEPAVIAEDERPPAHVVPRRRMDRAGRDTDRPGVDLELRSGRVPEEPASKPVSLPGHQTVTVVVPTVSLPESPRST